MSKWSHSFLEFTTMSCHLFAPGFENYKNGCTWLAAASDKIYQWKGVTVIHLWQNHGYCESNRSRKCWYKSEKVLGLKILFWFSTEWQKLKR
jgi:hypothetical protein